MMNIADTKDCAFEAFVTNLGKYNEGCLVGEWVKFPVTNEEMQAVFRRIGIGRRYELAVGGIAFPVYSERLRLSEAVGGEADAQGALIAKETFGAFASAVAAAQTLRSTTRFSTVLSLLSGILGLCLCALLLYWGSAAAVSPFHIAAFQLIWALVAGFLSGILQRL